MTQKYESYVIMIHNYKLKSIYNVSYFFYSSECYQILNILVTLANLVLRLLLL